MEANLHNPMAESAVLGAMLSDELALHDATAALRAEDFFLDSHQRLFRCLRTMAEAGKHIDLLTATEALKATGELTAIGGEGYLCDLTDSVPRRPDITSYVSMLQDRSLARKGINACQAAQQRLLGRADSATEVLDDLSRQLVQERPDDSRRVGDVLPRALKMLEPGSYTRISTGVPELDEMTRGGGRTKELWIIGAQPSAGKSALCRQIERSVMRGGFGLHSHTIEVEDATWVNFHLADMASVPAWKLREPELLNVVERDAMMRAAVRLDQTPYLLDDAGSVHIETLLAKSRLSVMRHGTRVVTVDYLQMLSGSLRDRKELMGDVARRLKQFAKDNDCWVIALSQLTRQGDINIRPTVQHLKESGDLEAAADVIVLNYRPKDMETGQYTGEDELIVGKQRNGRVGAIPMFFNPQTLTFGERRQ